MSTEAAHLEGEWVGWLSPDSELEEIELGERACDWLTDWMAANAYSELEACVQAGVRTLVGTVASATSWRGLPYPPEWWPPSAGTPAPDGRAA